MPLDLFIPYWGDPEYMRQTVRSVLNQNNPDWLLTIVDDAYPGEEIRSFVAEINDPRITYIRKEKNEGITENFRSCVSLATQDVMVMIGSDDLLLPNYVDVIQDAHYAFPNASIIQPGVQVIDDNGYVTKTLVDTVKQKLLKPRGRSIQILSGEPLATSLMHGDWLYWPSLAFRTESIRKAEFNDNYAVIQDLAIIMDMLFQDDELALAPTVCFSYRRHSLSASSEKLVDGSRFEGESEYYSVAAAMAAKRGWKRTAFAARLRVTSRGHALSIFPSAIRTGSQKTAAVLLRHAFGWPKRS